MNGRREWLGGQRDYGYLPRHGRSPPACSSPHARRLRPPRHHRRTPTRSSSYPWSRISQRTSSCSGSRPDISTARQSKAAPPAAPSPSVIVPWRRGRSRSARRDGGGMRLANADGVRSRTAARLPGGHRRAGDRTGTVGTGGREGQLRRERTPGRWPLPWAEGHSSPAPFRLSPQARRGDSDFKLVSGPATSGRAWQCLLSTQS
jgi:hypothetical protein